MRAAERVLDADSVRVYDDPGCLLRELGGDLRGAVFFAAADGGEWIPLARARFEHASRPTPMGYGLVAVDAARASSGALDLEGAIAFVGSGASAKR